MFIRENSNVVPWIPIISWEPIGWSANAVLVIAGSLEAAYSLNWGAQKIWGKGGGGDLGTFMISRPI